MSIKIASHVWEHSLQTGTALLMLLAISDHANNDGIAWPSIKTLAAKCRISERQAKRLVKKLADEGEIIINVGGGRGHASLYRVILEKGDADDTVYAAKGDIHDINRDIRDKRVTSGSVKGDVAMSPEPSINHHKEPSRNRYSGNLPTKNRELPALPIHLAANPLLNAWGEWAQHHIDRGRPLTLGATLKQFRRFEQMGNERAAAAIEYSISNNYTALVEPKSSLNEQQQKDDRKSRLEEMLTNEGLA